MKLTIPCFIRGLNDDVERLMFKFGNARRRAYSMKQKGVARPEILKQLRRETGLPSRYVSAAYDTIKGLPPHVTFGGLELQRLREKGKISREEFHLRRNNLLVCRGDRSMRGNVCLRVEGDKLRVNVGTRKWVWLSLFIPEKYRGYLNDPKPYTVVIRRRDDNSGYDVRITVDVDEPEMPEPKRVMALDLNAGHVDFAVVEKRNLRPVAFGRINCHELLSSRKGKNQQVVHKTVNKIMNIARHYKAEVVAGKLRTVRSNSRRANRKIHRMSQFKLRQVMRYKLPLNGVKFGERSEAHTSKIGEVLSRPMGLDVHKASAYAFAVKVIDHHLFTLLRGVLSNEGDGILRQWQSGGSGPTAPHQTQGLVRDEVLSDEGYLEIPGIRGLSFLESLKTGLPCLRVKIC
jgi:IS605 OrfB family transposase